MTPALGTDLATERLRERWWIESYGMTRLELLAEVLAERYAPPPSGRDKKTSPQMRRVA